MEAGPHGPHGVHVPRRVTLVRDKGTEHVSIQPLLDLEELAQGILMNWQSVMKVPVPVCRLLSSCYEKLSRTYFYLSYDDTVIQKLAANFDKIE